MPFLTLALVVAAHASAQTIDSSGFIATAEAKNGKLVFTQVAQAAAPSKKQIRIYWVDTGINFQFAGFGEPFPSDLRSAVDLPSGDRFSVVMPDRSIMPDGPYQRALAESLYRQISNRATSSSAVEIRTIQDINLSGYFSFVGKDQEVPALVFTYDFLSALQRVRQRLEKEGFDVEVTGAVGSNGTYTASVVIPWLQAQNLNPIDQLAMYDGRACFEDVSALIEDLGQRVAIVNTAGDAPAVGLPGCKCKIASLDCSKELKQKFPDIRFFWAADPDGPLGMPLRFHWSLFPVQVLLRHLAMMSADTVSEVKEYLRGGGYYRLGRMSGQALFAFSFPPTDQSSAPTAAPRSSTGSGRGRGSRAIRPPKGDDGLRRCRSGDRGCMPPPESRLYPPPCPPWLPGCGAPPVAGGPPFCPPWLPECRPPGAPSPIEPLGLSASAGPVRTSTLPDFLRIDICPVFEPLPQLFGKTPPVIDILLSK